MFSLEYRIDYEKNAIDKLGITKKTFDLIRKFLSSSDTSESPDFTANSSQPFDDIEPPDDPLVSLAAVALDDIVINIDLQASLRREARKNQFRLSNMEWVDVLGDDNLCRLILFALKLWETQENFGGISRALMADVRSMMGELNLALSLSNKYR